MNGFFGILWPALMLKIKQPNLKMLLNAKMHASKVFHKELHKF